MTLVTTYGRIDRFEAECRQRAGTSGATAPEGDLMRGAFAVNRYESGEISSDALAVAWVEVSGAARWARAVAGAVAIVASPAAEDAAVHPAPGSCAWQEWDAAVAAEREWQVARLVELLHRRDGTSP